VSNVTLSTPTPSDLLPTPASFALSQPLLSVPKRQPPISIKSHTEVKRKTWSALSDHDAGELAIAVTGGWIRLNDDSTALAEIDIRVDYQLGVGGQVVEGIVFDGESVYLSPTAYDSARVWTPCVDSLWERHTWELEFTVPAKIGDAQTMVVASGELMEQVSAGL
jgi:transcription initiation factor TFIID subunit 2